MLTLAFDFFLQILGLLINSLPGNTPFVFPEHFSTVQTEGLREVGREVAFVEGIENGKSSEWSHIYADKRVLGRSPEWAYLFAEERMQNVDEEWAEAYTDARVLYKKSDDWARVYATQFVLRIIAEKSCSCAKAHAYAYAEAIVILGRSPLWAESFTNRMIFKDFPKLTIILANVYENAVTRGLSKSLAQTYSDEFVEAYEEAREKQISVPQAVAIAKAKACGLNERQTQEYLRSMSPEQISGSATHDFVELRGVAEP